MVVNTKFSFQYDASYIYVIATVLFSIMFNILYCLTWLLHFCISLPVLDFSCALLEPRDYRKQPLSTLTR